MHRLTCLLLLASLSLRPAWAQVAGPPEPMPPADTGINQGRFIGVGDLVTLVN